MREPTILANVDLVVHFVKLQYATLTTPCRLALAASASTRTR